MSLLCLVLLRAADTELESNWVREGFSWMAGPTWLDHPEGWDRGSMGAIVEVVARWGTSRTWPLRGHSFKGRKGGRY